MCDEFTEADARRALSRRDFTVLGSAAALAGCAGTGAGRAAGADLVEDMVRVTTPDGIADGFFVHPAKGHHPGVLLWPDVAGLREAKKVMARRLAAAGYAVLVANPYYRGGPAPILGSFAEWRTPEGQARIKPLREALTAQAVRRDADAWVRFLDKSGAVARGRRLGSAGYCMGGPFTVFTAAARPDRVGAAASFHGAGLVVDGADSPHRLLAGAKATFLFAIARNDDARAPGDKDVLRQAAADAGREAEVEVYPADHGWCVPDSPVYDPVQADRAWERMLALFAKL